MFTLILTEKIWINVIPCPLTEEIHVGYEEISFLAQMEEVLGYGPTSLPFSGFMGECVKMEQIETGYTIGWGDGKRTLEPGFLPLAIMPRPEIGRRFQEKQVRLWRKTHFIFFMDIAKASLSLIYSVKCLAGFCT